MLNQLGFLLLQVPGVSNIPGIPPDFFSPNAGELVTKLYDKIFIDARILAVYLLIVTLGMYLIDKVYKNQLSFSMIVVNVLGTILLLHAINPVFEFTLQLGNGIATDIMSSEDIKALNKEFSEAAKEQERTTTDKLLDVLTINPFLKTLSSFAAMALGISIWSGIYAILALLFLISIQVTMLLWKTLALILYLFAPICVAFGVIPGFGTRILASWYGAVVQLSAWQIWIALTSWMVKESNNLFFQSLTGQSLIGFDPREQFNAIVLATLFIILNFAGPVLISLLIPTSRFVAGATAGIAFVTNSITQTVKNGVQTAVSLGTKM